MTPLEALAKSQKENLLKVLEEVKAEIADIRKGNYSNEARLCAIEFLDKLLVEKIKVLSGELSPNEDKWN
jgi:hypothetical protein